MSFNNGDIVRIGNGKVEYTVKFDGEKLDLIGAKSNRRNVDPETLTLVHSDWLSDDEIETEISEGGSELGLTENDEFMLSIDGDGTEPVAEWNNTYTVPDEPYAEWEIRSLHPTHNYVLHVDGTSKTYKSYNAAADALVIAGRAGYNAAAIDHNGKRLVQR